MKRFKEPLKTLLILLLTASAVFLAWKGSLFAAFFPERKGGAVSPTPEPSELSYTASALPLAHIFSQDACMALRVASYSLPQQRSRSRHRRQTASAATSKTIIPSSSLRFSSGSLRTSAPNSSKAAAVRAARPRK